MRKKCVKTANIDTRRRSEVSSKFSTLISMDLIGLLDESESFAYIGFADMALPSSGEEDHIARRNLFIVTSKRLFGTSETREWVRYCNHLNSISHEQCA